MAKPSRLTSLGMLRLLPVPKLADCERARSFETPRLFSFNDRFLRHYERPNRPSYDDRGLSCEDGGVTSKTAIQDTRT